MPKMKQRPTKAQVLQAREALRVMLQGTK